MSKAHCRCQPQPCHARREAEICPHGRKLACFTRHRADDPRLGQPLCPDCYDHAAHVVWNNHTGELWRRTKQAIERHLTSSPATAASLSTGCLAATAGTARSPSGSATAKPPNTRPAARSTSTPCSASTATTRRPRTARCPHPPGITVADLEDATRHAAAAITYLTPPHPASPGPAG